MTALSGKDDSRARKNLAAIFAGLASAGQRMDAIERNPESIYEDDPE